MKKLIIALLMIPAQASSLGIEVDGWHNGTYYAEIAITAKWRIDKLTCRVLDKEGNVLDTDYVYNLNANDWETLRFYIYEKGTPNQLICR